MTSRAVVLSMEADVRSALASALRRLALEPVEASSADEVMSAVDEGCRVAVLEVEAGAMMLCREIHERRGSALPVLLFSRTRTEPADRVAGFLVGADDYLVAPVDADELVCRVRRSLAWAEQRATPSIPSLGNLTERESEVLHLLVAGYTQKQIATRLAISVKTVGTHIQHLLTKLNLHSRTDAVALAIRAGLESGVSTAAVRGGTAASAAPASVVAPV